MGIMRLGEIVEGLVGCMDDGGEEGDIMKGMNKDGWVVEGECGLYDLLW